MKIKQLKKYWFLIPIIAVILILSFIDPASITEKLGTQNTYIAMFIIALI